MLSAMDLAHYVIARTDKIHHGINNLKLQMMLYFIQAEFLVAFDKPCFADDIEARSFGVCVPLVHRQYKVYAAGRIWYMEENHPEWLEINVSPDEKYHINAVIDDLLNYSSSQLGNIIMRQEPWIRTYRKDKNRIIPNALIKSYFED